MLIGREENNNVDILGHALQTSLSHAHLRRHLIVLTNDEKLQQSGMKKRVLCLNMPSLIKFFESQAKRRLTHPGITYRDNNPSASKAPSSSSNNNADQTKPQQQMNQKSSNNNNNNSKTAAKKAGKGENIQNNSDDEEYKEGGRRTKRQPKPARNHNFIY